MLGMHSSLQACLLGNFLHLWGVGEMSFFFFFLLVWDNWTGERTRRDVLRAPALTAQRPG